MAKVEVSKAKINVAIKAKVNVATEAT